MIDKNIHHIVGIQLLLLSPIIWAAPPLSMHIFEQQEEKDKEKTNNIIQSPLLEIHVFEQDTNNETINKKVPTPSLKIHLYDNSTTLQNNAVVAKHYIKEEGDERGKPALSYIKSNSDIKIGHRRDDLNWSIAGPDGVPNILSELTWKDIEISTISSDTTLFFEENWLLNFNVLVGHIYKGKNQDSDYFGNDRTLEFSRSNNNANEGSVLDLSVSTGYNWIVPFNQASTYPSIEFSPQIGLSYYSQYLKAVDGNQTISEWEELDVTLGPFAGLNSTYDANWFGPWLGLTSTFNFTESFSLSLNVEYHYAKYSSTADWNLRGDFSHPESFTQKANGYGLIGSVEGKYKLNTQLAFILSIKYQDWQAHDHGIDKVFLSDDTTLTTQYNGVNWHSLATNIGLVYSF
jgi:hypothetical protein